MKISIRGWISEISRQPGFESWVSAQWESYPLGPGSHSWVVILETDGKEAGYLVVGAQEDGDLKLLEYGAGEYPLFSQSTLYQALMQHALIPSKLTYAEFLKQDSPEREKIYRGPMEAYWRLKIGGNTRYVDAVTGEDLPEGAGAASGGASPLISGVKGDSLLQSGKLLTDFDPYERLHWLKGTPETIGKESELGKLLSGGNSLTFAGRAYQQTVLLPLAVTGYHQWSGGTLFLRCKHGEGTRYLPARALIAQGEFYRS